MDRMDELHRAKVKERSEEKIAQLDELQRQMLPPDRCHHIGDARPVRESQVLRRQQEEEFALALDESRREEEENERAEGERRARWEGFVAQFRALPPEPATGTTIQAVMPAGKKVTRTFEPDTLGELLYVWCAGQTVDAQNLLPEQIDIVAPVGNVRVDRHVGLREQGISGKFVVVVSVKQ
jgi:hypothetical protein